MPERENGPRLGIVWFAVAMLMLAGLFHLTVALVALFRSASFAGTPVFGSFAQWAIFGLIVAGLLFLAAALITEGQRWGRILGIALAMVSAVGQLLFANSNPAWSVLVIAVDIIIIWALAMHGELFTSAQAGNRDDRR